VPQIHISLYFSLIDPFQELRDASNLFLNASNPLFELLELSKKLGVVCLNAPYGASQLFDLTLKPLELFLFHTLPFPQR
jgi:hypothetical protein